VCFFVVWDPSATGMPGTSVVSRCRDNWPGVPLGDCLCLYRLVLFIFQVHLEGLLHQTGCFLARPNFGHSHLRNLAVKIDPARLAHPVVGLLIILPSRLCFPPYRERTLGARISLGDWDRTVRCRTLVTFGAYEQRGVLFAWPCKAKTKSVGKFYASKLRRSRIP
jgi:hypothetical protein